MATMNKPARGSTSWQTAVNDNWTSIENNLIDKSILTTKGDLLGASGSATPVRVAVGSDGQVLSADNAQTPGIKWADFSSDKAVVTSSVKAFSSTSTTSTTFVDMDSMSLDVDVGTGGTAVIIFNSSIGGASNNGVAVRIVRDSTELRVVSPRWQNSTWTLPTTIVAFDQPSAGTYTYKVQWLVSAATGYQNLALWSSDGDRELVAVVLPA
jgi:hypothetical protein